ncbi:hypothetical protein roselon_03321 [Roseibacterium elongatum DSM 19469]|uniref:Uncharacterized protein n=1 Tax=Roseicyclus elongatus DSM 19469 TaxID=1294273 RepID=W8RWK3_9RHOB|nr:hypothetical protein roselon_03321 [Roseibacterium elongatum DSM 19469]
MAAHGRSDKGKSARVKAIPAAPRSDVTASAPPPGHRVRSTGPQTAFSARQTRSAQAPKPDRPGARR